MNETTMGQYICFQNNQRLIPATMGFDLKLKPESCPPSDEKTDILIFQEGSSALLTCPHTASETDFKWFKDGQRHYQQSDQILFPDGSLYIDALQYSDQGLYVCQIFKKDSLCERNHTLDVTVLVSSKSICGQIETEHPHPWAVSLWQDDEIAPLCYGTLIHESWVVTSAQCLSGFYRKKKLNVYVRFTDTRIIPGYDPRTPSKFQNIKVKAVKIHPKFSKKMYVNDVGLVQLVHPVNFTNSVRPICLTETDLTLKTPCDRSPPISGTVAGWGPLESNEDEQLVILHEFMSVVTSHNSGCFSTDHSYFEKIICASKTNETNTTLAGDTGSPFEVLWKDRNYLLGVYSWGERSVLLGDHDYFTKISDYVPWMNGFTGEASTPDPQ